MNTKINDVVAIGTTTTLVIVKQCTAGRDGVREGPSYLHHGQDLWQGVLCWGHGGQETEEVVGGRVGQQLEVIGRVLEPGGGGKRRDG